MDLESFGFGVLDILAFYMISSSAYQKHVYLCMTIGVSFETRQWNRIGIETDREKERETLQTVCRQYHGDR